MSTKLDANQVLKAVFDDTLNRLNVSADIDVVTGDLEVKIDGADGDNVRISDGLGDFLAINGDGSINVNITSPISLDINAASGDSIKISDGTDTLLVNNDGSINVNLVTAVNGTVLNRFEEITDIASGITETITSYNAMSTGHLFRASVSGTNIATYEVLLNGDVVDKRRTYFSNLNENFIFDKGLLFESGDLLEIKVFHSRPMNGDFSVRLEMSENE